MPLTAGKRDEENERFKNTLQRLVALTFVPDNFEKIDSELSTFGLNLESLQKMTADDLMAHIKMQKLDFENLEQFADFLAAGFPMLAKAAYEFVQHNSGTFSFVIFNKLAALKLP